MGTPIKTIFFPSSGMNSAINSSNLSERFFARSTNIQIKHQLPTTRMGITVHTLVGLQDNDDNNFQGAIRYNPSKGQSQKTFSLDFTSIIAAINGRKFQFIPATDSKTNVIEVTGIDNGWKGSHYVSSEEETLGEELSAQEVLDKFGEPSKRPLLQNQDVHLNWLVQAESYVIGNDGNSNTWIWQGFGDPFFSSGYTTRDKENSKLANGAAATVYAHGRILQTVNGSQIVVGDIIHKKNLSDPENILDTTEQVYNVTGAFFSPPSSMGSIIAGEILPLRNTQHGHGDILWHCLDEGVFSIDVTQPDRSKWSDLVITRHVLLGTSARGPYAIAVFDGDQMFRSRHGIQTIRSAAAESQKLGNPHHPISEEVNCWLDNDYEPYLRFCSLVKWEKQKRIFCTTDHWVKGKYRGSTGAVSLNLSPVDSVQQVRPAWEGLITLPNECKNIIQFVGGQFAGKDRMFAFCYDDEFNLKLIEFHNNQKYDILEDGNVQEISSQVITRSITGDEFFSESQYTTGKLFFANVERNFKWGVWVRTEENNNWCFWSAGEDCVQQAPIDCDITAKQPKNLEIPLGSLPKESQSARRLQFLVRWKGYGQFEGLQIYANAGDDNEEGGKPRKNEKQCHLLNDCCNYDDLEYSNNDYRWEDEALSIMKGL